MFSYSLSALQSQEISCFNSSEITVPSYFFNSMCNVSNLVDMYESLKVICSISKSSSSVYFVNVGKKNRFYASIVG